MKPCSDPLVIIIILLLTCKASYSHLRASHLKQQLARRATLSFHFRLTLSTAMKQAISESLLASLSKQDFLPILLFEKEISFTCKLNSRAKVGRMYMKYTINNAIKNLNASPSQQEIFKPLVVKHYSSKYM